jgi:DNA-binding XRE family transcriptional regulator
MTQVGSQNHNAKLTEEQVHEIKRFREDLNSSYNELAESFGVSEKTIYNIINGKRWKHVQ